MGDKHDVHNYSMRNATPPLNTNFRPFRGGEIATSLTLLAMTLLRKAYPLERSDQSPPLQKGGFRGIGNICPNGECHRL